MFGMFSRLFCVSCFVFLNVTGEENQLPPALLKCYRYDPKVNECLKIRFLRMMQEAKAGSKELEIEPLDPLVFNNLVFKYKNIILGGSVTIPKAVIEGLSGGKIPEFRVIKRTDKQFIVDFDTFFEKLRITTSPYRLNGNIGQLSASIDGNFAVELNNVTLTYYIASSAKPVDGRDYMFLDNFRWRLKGDGIQNLKILNNDIVHDRPVLSRVVQTLINSSWRILKNAVVAGLLPEAEKNLKIRFAKFLRKYPYDVLLTPPKKNTT